MQRCALDGGNCILWRCGQNSTLRLQATAGERAQPDATELHLRVPSAAGAIRFLTTDRVSWCLTTIGEIVKRLLVAFTRIVNRGRNVGHILDVQIRQGDARAAAHAEISSSP